MTTVQQIHILVTIILASLSLDLLSFVEAMAQDQRPPLFPLTENTPPQWQPGTGEPTFWNNRVPLAPLFQFGRSSAPFQVRRLHC